MPSREILHNQSSRRGRPEIGIRHFGQKSVSGFSRVPVPAASSNAFMGIIRTKLVKAGGQNNFQHYRLLPANPCIQKNVFGRNKIIARLELDHNLRSN